ncbi:hypothetical protein GCG21_13600 [Pseudactinotalea sp. HY160]|uniref:hypothetical protein n=1 Tax=Pseudactinotalea sp. HY160 TaxID=2654490 RepID=UPI00128B6E33|nr:hypothetical protein [Pseudactinotalea sp. HY160]MPV51021.1 hypothetical protein [Pseudactinotalea sp. HY160]
MSARRRPSKPGFELPESLVSGRMQHRSSGAAGVHADQNARRLRAGGRTNRVGARSSQRRAAITDQAR